MNFQRQKLFFFAITITLLLFSPLNSRADESVPVSDEAANEKDKQKVPDKVHESKPDEIEPLSNGEEKANEIKVDKCDQPAEIGENKQQNLESETNKDVKAPESKASQENVDDSARSEKEDNVAVKKEENNQSPESNDGKKQISKEENNHKTDLNDVNFLRDAEDHAGPKYEKREAFRESVSDYLGLPRDASYFFDDLEPFINNNSDNRVGRSAPNKECKGQKSKLSKGRDVIEVDDVDEDEDELRDEEEEEDRQSEDDYDDDDDDMDSDCKPTTPQCTTKPQCTTSTCPPPTTKKCTTQFQCPTKCPTPAPCPTKCPPKCAKPNRQRIGQAITTEKTVNWDADKKRLISVKKRRFHSKIAPSD